MFIRRKLDLKNKTVSPGGGLHCLQSSVLQINAKPVLRCGYRETPLSVGLAGGLAVQLTGDMCNSKSKSYSHRKRKNRYSGFANGI